MRKSFKGHTACKSAVSNYRNNLTLVAIELAGSKESKCRRNWSWWVTVYKKVVRAFVFICEAWKTACFSQSREFFIAAGKKLMGITLMAYIPDNGILRAVENAVKRNCELNNTKITCKMAAVFSNNIDYCCSDFGSQLLKFLLRKLFDVFRWMYFWK